MAFSTMASRKSNSFTSITLGLLSPEEILDRSRGEILSQKQSIIDPTNQKKKVCFVKKYLVQQKIGSVIVVSTSVFDIEGLYVIDVVLR